MRALAIGSVVLVLSLSATAALAQKPRETWGACKARVMKTVPNCDRYFTRQCNVQCRGKPLN
jgi:hypothetical protein